jgi:uncharacterized protein (TIGR03437 family)
MNHITRFTHYFRSVPGARSLLWSALLLMAGLMKITVSAQTGGVNPQPFVTVSAASYRVEDMAPGSIVAGFGTLLATTTLSGADTDSQTPGIQLPKQLGGTTVRVGGIAAELFYVSPGQINYVIPPTLAAGMWPVEVVSGDATISNGTVTFGQALPSIFTADSSGSGAPAALLLRVKTDGSQVYENVSFFDATAGRFLLRPIDFGPTGERIFLALFLSGIRTAADPNGDGNVNESVRVIINGSVLVPDYAGPQGGFIGLDQINVELPRSLQSSSLLDLAVSILGGQSSNLVSLAVNTPPVSSLNWTASGLSGRVTRSFTSIDNLLFAATNQGVFRSTDFGANWMATSSGLTNADVLSLYAFGARLIAGTNGGGIFISTDFGATWTVSNSGLSGDTLTVSNIFALGSTLYLATPGGVCVSTNNGQSWTALNAGLTGLNLNILNFAAIPNGGFFAATRGGVCLYNRTTNQWEAATAGFPNNSYATTLAWNGSSLFAGTNGFGVCRYNGQTWSAINNGIPANAFILSLIANGASLIAGTANGGLYVSNNNGDTWTLLASGLGSADVSVLFPYRGRLCAGTPGGVFGARLSVPTGNRAPVAFAASLATIANSGGQNATRLPITLLGSDADGDALIYLFTNPTNGALAGFAPNLFYTPNANFTGSDSFTFRVSDGTVESAPATITITVSPANRAPNLTVPQAQTITAGQALNFTVAATDPDAGQTVTLTTGGLPNGATFTTQNNQGQFTWTPAANQTGVFTVNFIAIDSGSPRQAVTRAVTITVNPASSGGAWTAMNTGLGNLAVQSLTFFGGILYAGTDDGVFRSRDGGQNWTAINTGFGSNRGIFALAVLNNRLWAGGFSGLHVLNPDGAGWTAVTAGLPGNVVVQTMTSSGSTLNPRLKLFENNNR